MRCPGARAWFCWRPARGSGGSEAEAACAQARARGGCPLARRHACGVSAGLGRTGRTVRSTPAPRGWPRPTTPRSRARAGGTEDSALQPRAAGRPLPKRQRQSREAASHQPHAPSRHDYHSRRHCARTGHAQRLLARLLRARQLAQILRLLLPFSQSSIVFLLMDGL